VIGRNCFLCKDRKIMLFGDVWLRFVVDIENENGRTA
jgi:hypothetical protein